MKILLIFLMCSITITSAHAQSEAYIKETKEWVKKTTKQANKGKIDAMLELGKFYKNPYSSFPNPKNFYYGGNWLADTTQSLTWLRLGLAKGNAECAYELAAYYNNPIMQKDTSTSATVYYYKIAADMGWQHAMIALAGLYRYKIKDYQGAKYWYKIAMDHGVDYAAKELQEMELASTHSYEDALAAYNTGKYQEALTLFEASANVNNNVDAMDKAGDMYATGTGTAKDLVKAQNSYWRGMYYRSAKCSYKLANLYFTQGEYGWWDNAKKYYDSAIVQGGYADAQTKLDDMLTSEASQKAHQEAIEADWKSKQLTKADLGAPPSQSEIDFFNKTHTGNNNQPAAPAKTTTTAWGTPAKTGAELDQEMYDKMHKEQNDRERNAPDKYYH